MDSQRPDQASPAAQTPGDERLDSWKEIAAYLKREVRTLHRWEAQERLPIHRHLHKERGSVYAYKAELDAWLNNRRLVLERTAPVAEEKGRPRRRLRLISVAAAIAVVMAALTIYLARSRIGPPRMPSGKIMLAVLPFENMSGQPEEEYFSDGLTDELITHLGGLEPIKLGVIARTSAMQFKRAAKSAGQVGHELGVDFILEGTVRREGSRVRVSVKLIQVTDQTQLWTQSYERELGNILSFHDEVARDVARRIQIQLTPQKQATLSAARSVNPDAYESYLKGLYFSNKFTNPDFHKSIEYYEKAIEEDADYAPAYAGLATSYLNLVEFGEPPTEFYPKSEAAARKAIEIDGTSSQAYAALSWSLIEYRHDWEAAERALLRAVELNSSNSYARMLYARYLAALGRFDQAREQAERARQIDPVSVIINVVEAQVLFYQRQYDPALLQLTKMLEMDPNFPPTYWTLAHIYEAMGKQDEACRNMLKTFDLGSGHQKWFAELEKVRVRSGWREASQQWVRGILDPRAPGYVQPYDLVEAYVNLGRDQDAIMWLRKAAEARDVEIVFLKVDPRFDRFRADPRFQGIVHSLNFPE